LVSIVTPTYNHRKFIGQCIESVLGQSYPYWEQIVVDDGSTDGTGELVAGYRDGRIRYVRQENVGIWRLAETYNKALQLSQGELVAVLEGDDFWPADKLERQITAFGRQEVVLSWGKAAVTNSRGRTLYIIGDPKWFTNRTREKMLRKLLISNFIPNCTVMCRKDALLSIGGFKQQPEYAPYVDYSTWLQLSLIGEFYPVDELLGYYRRHEGQTSMTMIVELNEAATRCSMDFFELLSPRLRDSLGISAKELLNKRQYWTALAHLSLGRMELTQHKWTEARKNLRLALDSGSFFTRTKALLGIVCAYLRVDLEWVAFLMRRRRLKNFLC